MIKGVIFDVGATIIDFPAMGSSEVETGIRNVADVVASWSPIDVHTFCQKLSRAVVSSPKQGVDFRQINTYRDIIAGVVEDYIPDVTHTQLQTLEDEFTQSILSGISPVDGMIEVVQLLSKQIRLAVASNTRSHNLIQAALEQINVLSFFSPFVTSMSCGYRKPGKHIFEEVLFAWSVQPESVVMIGDKLDRDIVGAKALGIRTIWFDRNHESPSALPDAITTRPSDVLTILKTWGLDKT